MPDIIFLIIMLRNPVGWGSHSDIQGCVAELAGCGRFPHLC